MWGARLFLINLLITRCMGKPNSGGSAMKIKSFQVTGQRFLQEVPAGEISPLWF
jgi:hypothetical protein